MGASESTATGNTWSAPCQGRYKMNTDGSCRPPNQGNGLGPSGYAGVLRDHRGKWVRGFHGFIEESDCLTAEIYGIYYGLVLLDKLGLKEATLESDSAAAIKFITDQENNSNRNRRPIINNCWEEITECRRLVDKNKVSVIKCSRDSNKLADKLADIAREKQDPYTDITIIPDGEIKRIAEQEEEESQRASGGISTAAGAAMAVAATGVAVWGISRMFSNNRENQENEGAMTMEGYEGSIPTRNTWSAPCRGRYKMNTDGTCRPNQGNGQGPSGYAGVLRDHCGNWVRGFHGFIGVSDCLTAEIYGIYYGLVLLDELGLKEATLESDCAAAIEWITQEENSNRSRRPIINNCWVKITECKRLVLKNKVSVSKCNRNSNKLADKLADMAILKQDPYTDITIIPDGEIKRIAEQESRFAN